MARRGAILALAALAALTTIAAGGAQASDACGSPDDFKHVAGLGPACETEDGYELRLEDGSTVLTHGPDPVEAFVDESPETTSSGAPGPGEDPPETDTAFALSEEMAGAPPWAPYCVDEGADERRTVALHALPADGDATSRTRTLRDAVVEASTMIQQAAREQGAYTAPRIACDDEGWISVERVRLDTPSSQDSFRSIVDDLRELGYDSERATYLVFYEDGFWCRCGGMATIDRDDRPGPENANNHGPAYAVVNQNYDWSEHEDHLWKTALHEWGHNMGAVQFSAPNSYNHRGGHCSDELDIMCYGPDTVQVCEDEHFDCNHDDYFHPNPGPGSYLDTHWNVAGEANGFVERAELADLPTPPRALSATPGQDPGSVRLQWLPPRDDGSAPVERYVVYRDTSGLPVHQFGVKWASAPEVRSVSVDALGTLKTPVDATEARWLIFQDEAYGGTDQVFPRTYRVSAVNDLGEGRLSNSATVAATPTPQGVPFVPS